MVAVLAFRPVCHSALPHPRDPFSSNVVNFHTTFADSTLYPPTSYETRLYRLAPAAFPRFPSDRLDGRASIDFPEAFYVGLVRPS